MKKIFFSIFAVAALALTSCAGGAGAANVLDMDASKCDDTTDKCWKYTASYAGVNVDAHLWGTEKFIVETIQQTYGAVPGYTVTLSPADADSPEACLGLNQ